MSWEDIGKMKENAGGNYLRLKDGDEIVCMFVGEPSPAYYSIYKDPTRYKTRVEGSKITFDIPCVVKEGDHYETKTWSFGFFTALTLKEMKDEYGMDYVYKIKRKGASTDTRYHILPQRKITDAEKAKFSVVSQKGHTGDISDPQMGELHDVPPHTDEDKPGEDDDGIPF